MNSDHTVICHRKKEKKKNIYIKYRLKKWFKKFLVKFKFIKLIQTYCPQFFPQTYVNLRKFKYFVGIIWHSQQSPHHLITV